MEGSDSDGENEESVPDGVKKRIHKLIKRFKQVTSKDRTTSDSAVIHTHNSNTEKEPTLSEDDVYDFSHPKRGYAVFIINSKFDTQSKRPFADEDCKRMLELFVMLDFEVKLLDSLTTKDLWQQLNAIKSQIGQDCDCFACVISSHGAEVPVGSTSGRFRQHIIFTKDGTLPTSKIMEVFNSENCENLEGKPRMFFIQACRSIFGIDENISEIDQGFEFELVNEEIEKESVPTKLRMKQNIFQKVFHKQSAPDTRGQTGEYVDIKHTHFKATGGMETCRIPCFEDYLVMFSSSSEKIAWSDCGKGGWLIYCLYEVFKHLLDTDESVNLLQVLTNVCCKMASELQTHTPSLPVYHKSKSAATIYHMLTKDIILKPVAHTKVPFPSPIRETAV